ncbi:MAG: cytochrome c [Pseudomonadota bacterium]
MRRWLQSPNTFSWMALVIASTGLTLAPEAIGHGGAKGIVLERHKSMIRLERAGNALYAMAESTRALKRKQLARHARVMLKESKRMRSQFPDTKRSRRGKGSRTSDRVWSHREEFDLMTDDLIELAKSLGRATAGVTKPDLRKRIAEIGQSCDSCHLRFRLSKKLAH